MALEKIETIIEEMKTGISTRMEACEKLAGDVKEDVKKELVTLKEQVEALETQLKERSPGLLPGLQDQVRKRKPSWVAIARGLKWGDWGDGYEKSILEEATARYKDVLGRFPGEQRTMGTETDSAGGYLVPSEMMTDLIEKLDARAVTLQAGARLLPGMTGVPVQWPKITGGATAYWEGESESITASDLSVGQLNMYPHRLAAMSIFPERLLRHAVPAVDATIEDDFAKRLALKLDLGILTGDGGTTPIKGILNLASVNDLNLGTNGGLLTWDKTIDMVGLVEDADADVDDPSAAFIWNPVVGRLLKKERTQADSGDAAPFGGEYIQSPPAISDVMLADKLGYKFFKTTQLVKTLSKGTSSALTYAFFGVWREILIPQWFGMTVRASTETSTAFEKSQVYLKAEMEVDVGVRHDESFAKSDEVATTNPVA